MEEVDEIPPDAEVIDDIEPVVEEPKSSTESEVLKQKAVDVVGVVRSVFYFFIYSNRSNHHRQQQEKQSNGVNYLAVFVSMVWQN